MSKIRGKDTSSELYIRRLLYSNGMRYRVNYNSVAGTPDLFFIGKHTAVFIHGCYWHRHENCAFAYIPKSNIGFWQKKFSENVNRDHRVISLLKSNSIRSLIIWECTIRKMQRCEAFRLEKLKIILTFIKDSDVPFLEI